MANDFSCPTDDVFLAMRDGESLSETIVSHIQQCHSCQLRLAQLEAEIVSLRDLAPEATRRDDSDSTFPPPLPLSYPTIRSDEPAAGAPSGSHAGRPIADGHRLGRFELVSVLGNGAFGQVHLAYDPHLDRKVAIKVAKKGMLVGKTQVDRFQREAQSAAQLRHPNIIPVYDVGQVEGRNYIVYEFVEGETLRAVLQRHSTLEQTEAAPLIATLAAALHYAHCRGIVHRDIKPDNILIDAHGEPHIADFGLAYRDQTETMRTREGTLMGTPAYMSPEQASGRGHQAGARADIWSLGVLLQELLTGQRPFQGPLNAVLQAIQSAEARPLPPSVAADLRAICQTCLAKDPEDRYPTALELQQDLQRWSRGEPVTVRPLGPLPRSWRWARRNSTVAALLAAVMAILAAGVLVSSYFAYQARQKAEWAAHEQRERAFAQVSALLTASPVSLPLILESLRPYRQAVLPRLAQLPQQTELSESEQRRVRLGLALLADGPPDRTRLARLLEDLTSSTAVEFLPLCDLLSRFGQQLRSDLWMQALHRKDDSPDARFRAWCALARYDPQAHYWEQGADPIISHLLTEPTTDATHWIEALRDVRGWLLPVLRDAFEQGEDAGQRVRAAMVLADLFHDDVELLVALVQVAEPAQLKPLLPKLQPHAERAGRLLSQRLPASSQAALAIELPAAKRQANTAVALLSLGQTRCVWPLLQQSSIKTIRTLLIHRLGPAGIETEWITRQLSEQTDPFVAAALILSLGEYRSDLLNVAGRESLLDELLPLYRQHPSPGVHSALDWLLRKWGYASRLRELDAALATRDVPSTRQWYVNRQRQTMAVFPGPVTFTMGSPRNEPDRGPNEDQHRRRIPRGFAISTKEITNEEFARFRQPTGQLPHKYSPEPACPVLEVNWYDALKYCRWLSEVEGISDDEMCLPPIAEIGPEMPPSAIRLDRAGYRLPTAAEWEYACRAGSRTRWHFGEDETMLSRYDWYSANSQNRTWPVGTLKPNDFGLFDVHAHALEWCQNPFFFDYPSPSEGGVVVDGSDPRTGLEFELRGGTFLHSPAVTRSAWRDFQLAAYRSYEFGFRIARTYNEHNSD